MKQIIVTEIKRLDAYFRKEGFSINVIFVDLPIPNTSKTSGTFLSILIWAVSPGVDDDITGTCRHPDVRRSKLYPDISH